MVSEPERYPPSVIVRDLRSQLLRWFHESKRQLPWRTDPPDPYRVLVSEFMLQQTQVETVVPYFHEFLTRFPGIHQLAEASEVEVLQVWSGLGYYRRARNLHQAARIIVERHGGHVPGNQDSLLALPGVGPYTAGAVLSIGFGVRAPVVDGNVKRVLARVFSMGEDLVSSGGQRRVWQLAEDLVSEDCPGEFNQALMELGALVCLSADPKCGVCPLAQLCSAHLNGQEMDFPTGKRKQRKVHVEEVVLLIRTRETWLLTKNNDESVYPGLWQFPWRWKRETDSSVAETAESLVVRLGFGTGALEERHRLKHTVTFRRIETRFFTFRTRRKISGHNPLVMKWASAEDLRNEALPGYQKRILPYLDKW